MQRKPFKLLRLSNGEQVLARVMKESNTEYEIQDMFRIYQRESYDGVHTGITNWLTFVDQEIIMMNKQHVTFVADINKDIDEYLDKKAKEDPEEEYEEAVEQEYKAHMMEYFANTISKVYH